MTAEITGVPELRAAFERVGRDMTTRVSRVMVVAAGGVLRTEAKRLAESQGLRRTGAFIRNIAIKRERTPAGVAQYHLGVRHGRNLTRKEKRNVVLKVGRNGRIVKQYVNDPFYWRFLEFGTRKMQPKPSLGPALDNKKDDALEAMQTRLNRELAKVRP